jgi:glyoxylase I family protein
MAEFILGMHHVSMLVKDTERSMRFYTNVLGMRTVVRPDLGFPGAWLAVGEQQIHLLELPNPDPVENRPVHGGRDRHLALRVADLSRLTNRLEQAGIDYTLSKSGRAALFCRDPDGNGLEFIQS